jgi:hypothetical protein
MNAEVYRFKLGDFECFAINDGTFTYEPPLIPPPADFLFCQRAKQDAQEESRCTRDRGSGVGGICEPIYLRDGQHGQA